MNKNNQLRDFYIYAVKIINKNVKIQNKTINYDINYLIKIFLINVFLITLFCIIVYIYIIIKYVFYFYEKYFVFYEIIVASKFANNYLVYIKYYTH